MVQIIPANQRKSSSQQFGEAFGRLTQGASQNMMQRQQMQQENEAAKRMGIDLEGIGPELRQQAFADQMKAKREQQNLQQELSNNSQKLKENRSFDDERFNTIKEHFGQEAAEIYKSAPEGGKTEILKHLLENRQRGGNLKDTLGNQESQKENDFDKGLTPREKVGRQERRYTTNLPLFEESKKKLDVYDYEKEALGIMEELSPQISGATRLNLNPKTGELLIPALGSPEAQKYVKTVNDFTMRAKDSYGSRVTNFDLEQFMKRLPTLANNEEGRRQIIDQMKIINEINSKRERALHDIIDESGGIRNIDFDRAQEMADKRTSKEVSDLRKRFHVLEKRSKEDFQRDVDTKKKIVPKGYVAVMRADGKTGYIPSAQVKQFLKQPGSKAL